MTRAAIYTGHVLCRGCHNQVGLVLSAEKGFVCPKCHTAHDLTNSSIPVVAQGKVLDANDATRLKQSAANRNGKVIA